MSERFGQFTRTQLLGRGGMGEVWKAWDGQLGRWVALKFLKGTGAEDLARFQREAQIASRLNHPNIAAIYEVGPNFIAMQFIEGTTLTPRKEAAKLISVAARAVHFAHEQGIVHRDLKPDNLMVTAQGHLFVMDFGLARPVEGKSDVSQSGMLVGTPHYMPPEQARGERVDARADVYSLGATLYELLAKRKPFQGANVFEILANVVTEEPKRPGVDPDLETIMMKCLEKEKERRYATAAELADDLDRYEAGEPIAAHAPSAVYRLKKFARRRKGALVVASIGLVAAALIAGIVLPGLMSESKARREGDAELARQKQRTEGLKELGTLWAQVILARQGLYKQKEDPVRVVKQLHEAVGKVGDYLRNHADQPQAYYVRARGLLYLNDFQRAEEDLRAAIRLNPEFGPGQSLLGWVVLEQCMRRLMGQGDATPPKRRFENARPFVAEATACLARGAAIAQSIADWGLIKTPEDDVIPVLSRAMTAEVEQDRAGALSILKSADAAVPSEEYRLWLGIMDRTDAQRIGWLTGAIDLMPHCAKAYLARGTAYEAAGDRAKALVDFDRSIAIDPGYAMAYCNRGCSQVRLKNLEVAIRDFTKAIEIDPRFAVAYFNRAHAFFSDGRSQAALADFDKAIECQPDYADAFDGRARTRALEGDLDRALEDCVTAIRIDPDFILPYLTQGQILQQRQDHEGSLRAFETALRLGPRHPEAHAGRGVARWKLGDLAGAVADLTKSIELEPTDPMHYGNRAQVLRRLGRKPEAIADTKKAIELSEAGSRTRRMLEVMLREMGGE